MTDRNRQRVAVITGAAVRVGRHITLALAEDGYDIVAGYRAAFSSVPGDWVIA